MSTNKHREDLKMKACTSWLLAAGSLLTAASLQAASPQSVEDQLRVMEQAATQSSVTSSIAPHQQLENLAWIEKARASLESGNHKTAAMQLDRAARSLYPVRESARIQLSGDKQVRWLHQVDRAISALLPVAQGLAREGEGEAGPLEEARNLHLKGQRALQDNQLLLAQDLLESAYEQLQAQVVAMRDGDRLEVAQVETDTRAAWKEAQRRYQDWLVTGRWMAQAHNLLNVDPDLIAEGSVAADSLYENAKDRALNGNFAEAVATMDQAYLTLERYWRQAGVDI